MECRAEAEQLQEKLIQSVVESAMKHKKDNYSYSQTYFQEEVTKMIQTEAKEIFAEWIEENRENIATAMRKYLTANKQEALTRFCENLANNINSYGINVNMILKDRDY